MKNYFLTVVLIFFWIGTSNAQNTALNFDGSDDYLTTNFGGILGNNPITVEAWVKTDALNNEQVITAWGSEASNGNRFTFRINQVSGNYVPRIEIKGGGINGSTNLDDGNWHHVAVTYDPTLSINKYKLYVDGILDTEDDIATTLNVVQDVNLQIGKRINPGLAGYFSGGMDDVRVWNTAKSQSTIAANMNAEICSQSTDLVAYFKFHDGVVNADNSALSSTSGLSSNFYTANFNTFTLIGNTSNFIAGPTISAGLNASFQSDGACDTYTWAENGMTYTVSGVYNEMLTNQAGCDSIVTLDLTVYPSTDDTLTVSACEEFTWNVNGTTYSSSGIYSEAYTSSGGCDSIKTLNLSIGIPYDETLTMIGCNEFYWDVNGMTYTSSGQHTEIFQDVNGCDSTITLDLSIVPLTNTISMNTHGVLKADRANISYQWIDCDTDMAIPGETNQEFMPTSNGSYRVVLDNGDCTDTSICLSIDNVSVNTFDINEFTIYPNPSNGSFKVEFNTAFTGTVKITDISGKQVFQTGINNNTVANFNLANIEKGIYFINLFDQKANKSTRKIIIE